MNAFLKKKNLRLPLPQSNRQFSLISWKNIAIGIIVAFFLLGFLYLFGAPIKNTFYTLTSPVSQIFWQAGQKSSGFLGSFWKVQGLSQENDNLKQENQQLLSKITYLSEALRQDQAVKQVLQNTQNTDFKLVLAENIGVDLANDFLLINKGLSDGISENMPVISTTKALYGRVYKVYKNFSQVMLISNKQSVVDAKIQDTESGKSPILGAVKGNGNLLLYLDLVTLNTQINASDTLITSGQEGIFPKNLLIGKISNVDKNDLKPFQTASVSSLSDIKQADNVFIITNYKK